MIQGLNPGMGQRFYLSPTDQTSTGAQLASCSVLLEFLALEVKELWLTTHLLLRLRMSRTIHPLLYAFIVSIQTTVPLPSHKAHKLQVSPPIYTIIMSYHFLHPSINAY